jgi:hypothetical protein
VARGVYGLLKGQQSAPYGAQCIRTNNNNNNINNTWTDGGCLLQTRRTLHMIQDHESRIKDTDAGLGSRVALYGGPYRRAMTER